MRIDRAIVGAVALLAAGGAAEAQQRLVLEPYPGPPWHEVLNQTKGPAFVREQLPVGQTPDNFRDVLTAQSIPGYRDAPATFISNAFAQFGGECDKVQVGGPTTAEEQGWQVAYGQLYCGRQKGQSYGVHIFFKAILGADALYIVDRDFRTPPSDNPTTPGFQKGREKEAIAFLEAEGAAMRYLRQQVYLCDPILPDPRCAAKAAPGR